MITRIVNKSGNPLPSYETISSAGMDLRAWCAAPIILQPMERAIIPTGLYIELPSGFEAQIRPRSGLAAKNGITVLNSPGTIDADYRGEIKVILINFSSVPFEIKSGDRIAQMIVSRFERIVLKESESLSETDRGAGGFGHTGVN